jgi:membrane dipeptidase
MLEALKENKGVIQICILNSYLKEDTLRDVRDAAYDSLRQKFGPYEEVNDPELQRQYREAYYAVRDRYPGPRADVKDLVDHIDHVKNKIGIDHVGIGSDFDGGGGITGCSDVSEFPNVTIELVRRGYSENEIRKIWGGNFMRVFREVREKAGETD